MQKRSISFTFILFIFLSILIFFISKSGIFSGPANLISAVASPIQHFIIGSPESESDNAAENRALIKKLVEHQRILADNQALRDQFATSYPTSQNLLPADVVSAPSFIPGVTSAEYLIINKGKKDGVKIGSAVVLKDNLVGKVTQVSDNLSKVILVSNPQINFSAITEPTKNDNKIGSLGLIKGDGGQEMILDNVLLSDSVAVGDYVATKGDLNVDNTGFPPSLIIGKVTSVEKKASELFQRAKVKSLINFSRLNMVFVVIKS